MKYPKLIERTQGKGRFNGWTDNTGHLVYIWEFDSLEDYAKFWADKEWHSYWMELNPLVDNLCFRLMRPSITIPEELT